MSRQRLLRDENVVGSNQDRNTRVTTYAVGSRAEPYGSPILEGITINPSPAAQPDNSTEESARMGRGRKRPLRKDWESVKDQAVLARFTRQLISVGNCRVDWRSVTHRSPAISVGYAPLTHPTGIGSKLS
jgi:hypothetical protein